MQKRIPQPTLAAITALLQPIIPEVTPEDILSAISKTGNKESQTPIVETVGRGLTISEAAKALSVSRATINRLLNAGKLTRIRASKRLVRISAASINHFLNTTDTTETQEGEKCDEQS